VKRNKSLRILGAAPLVIVTVIPVVTPGAWAQSNYKTLHRFADGAGGSLPDAGLIFDQAGNLYGTTEWGGHSGYGTAFRLTPNADGSWTESVLYSFCSLTNCSDGGFPQAGLVFDQTGHSTAPRQVQFSS
jgi:uncharacterized repeat protein (TIGR03803 family)